MQKIKLNLTLYIKVDQDLALLEENIWYEIHNPGFGSDFSRYYTKDMSKKRKNRKTGHHKNFVHQNTLLTVKRQLQKGETVYKLCI